MQCICTGRIDNLLLLFDIKLISKKSENKAICIYVSNTCSLIILTVRDVSIFVWRIQISCLLYKKLNDYGYVNTKV